MQVRNNDSRECIKWSPDSYQQEAFLAQEAGQEMLSRLDWMTISPKVIVDVGCGLGDVACGLAARFPGAKVYALDNCPAMIEAAKCHDHVEYSVQDAAQINLPDQSVDLIAANFVLSWVKDIDACIKEWRRVLSPNGVIMLSALGVDTLKELREETGNEIIPHLFDMHDIGDALVKVGFADPVMDVGRFPVRYRNAKRLREELLASGFIPEDFEMTCKRIQVTYEVIHGHAFKPASANEYAADDQGVVRVPISQLRQQLKGE